MSFPACAEQHDTQHGGIEGAPGSETQANAKQKAKHEIGEINSKGKSDHGHYPQHLHPGHYLQRIPSPDTSSEISIGENGLLQPGRGSIALQPLSRIRSGGSADPSRPKSRFEAWLEGFWIRNKGLFYVLMAQIFGVLMNVTTRQAYVHEACMYESIDNTNRILELEGNNGAGLHPFQILFARMSITVILASVYMHYKKIPDFPLGAREVRPLLVARGLAGFFGVFGMYYSLLYLPLADATVITFLAPGIACWVCSYVLEEPFTKMEQIATYVSLVGVVLIARPTSFFTSSTGAEMSSIASGDGDIDFASPINGTTPTTSHSAYDYSHITGSQRAKGVAVAMLGVLGSATAFTTLRWIGKRAHALISVNYFATWCTLVSIVMLFSLPGVGFLLPANLKEWCYLFFLGTCGFIMQFLLASGLQYEKSSRATNMVYMQMLFALGFDKLIFGTTPGWTSIVGSSLILGSAIYVAVQKDIAAKGNHPPAYVPVSQADADEEAGRANGANDLDDLVSSSSDDDDDDDEGDYGHNENTRL